MAAQAVIICNREHAARVATVAEAFRDAFRACFADTPPRRPC